MIMMLIFTWRIGRSLSPQRLLKQNINKEKLLEFIDSWINTKILVIGDSILDQFVYFMKPGDSFTFSTLGSYNLNIKIEDDGSVSVSSPGTKSAILLNNEIVSKNGILQFVDKVLLPWLLLKYINTL